MPILNDTPGWANALSGLITAYGMSQGMKNAKAEKERQAKIDAQNAALAQAQIQGEQARTAQAQQQTKQAQTLFPIQERSAGINPATGQPLNYGYTPQQLTKGMTNENLNQRAMFLGILAAKAQASGATDVAQTYGKQALETMQQSAVAQREQLQYQQFSEKLLMDAAQRAHLSNQDNLAYQRLSIEATRLQNEVNTGAIRASQAEQNLQLRAKEFGLSTARFNLEKSRVQSRTPIGFSQVMENLRMNANFKGLDPTSQTIVTQSLAAGRPMASIISTMQALASGKAHNPNVTQDQAQAIYSALTGQ